MQSWSNHDLMDRRRVIAGELEANTPRAARSRAASREACFFLISSRVAAAGAGCRRVSANSSSRRCLK